MIRFAADEDLDNDIIRGLRRRLPEVDIDASKTWGSAVPPTRWSSRGQQAKIVSYLPTT
jgi:hypothetical protein